MPAGSVLRRAFVEVEPTLDGFDTKLTTKLRQQDPGGKAGKQVGGQLNRALKRFELDPIDVKADPKKALAAIGLAAAKLRDLSGQAATVEVKVQTEQALGQLNRFRKQLGDVGDAAGPEAASGFVARFVGRAGPLLASMPISGPVAIAAGAAGAAAAPVLISALASGIAAGAGAGVLGVGIAAVAKDPVIKAKGAEVGRNFAAGIQREASEAFQGPVSASLDRLDDAGQRVTGRLGQAFDRLAPKIDPLTAKLVYAGETMTTSLIDAAEESGPALDGLGDSVVLLTNGVSHFVDAVADGGPEAAANLRLIAGATGDLIGYTGEVLNLFNKLANNPWITGPLLPLLRKHYAEAGDAAEQAAQGADKGAGSFTTLATVMTDAGRDAQATAGTLIGLAEASERLAGENLTAAESTLRLREATLKAKDAADKRGRVSMEEQQALLLMARATNTSTKALDAQGRSVDEATAAHESNRKKLIEVAERMGYSRRRAKELADQYLAIPSGVNTKIDQPGMQLSRKQTKEYDKQLDGLARQIRTEVNVIGASSAYAQLNNLLIRQQALKKGISVSAARSAFNKNAFAEGGWTGPGAKYKEAGIVHADEFVVTKEARQRVEKQAPGFLDAMNSNRSLPGYATGGRVLRAPFPVNAGVTRVPSLKEALSAVTPAAPTGGATAPFMIRVLRQAFPGLRIISSFRPGSRTLSGSRSYHSLNRAVDVPPREDVARYMYGNFKGRLKEAITPYQRWNVHNGRDHHYSGAVWRQHNFAGGNAHNHFAMDDGGFRTLKPGMNLVSNGTGRPEPIGGPAAMGALAGARPTVNLGGVVINVNGSGQSPRRIAEEINRELGSLVDIYTRTS